MPRTAFQHLVAALVVAAALLPSQSRAAPGQLDATFGRGGVAFGGVGPSGGEAIAAIALPDGKLLVAGNSLTGQQGVVSQPKRQFLLARFNGDGTPDATFGVGGHSLPTTFANEAAAGAMALQPDGKVVVVGRAGPSNQQSIAVARFNVDGSLDAGFGQQTFVVPGFTQSSANAVAVQGDGGIVVAGLAITGGNAQMVMMRLTAAGAPDTSFNVTGRNVFPLGSGSAALSALLLQPDGKLVAAGRATGASEDFALVRLNANGTFDTSFGCATPGTCTGRTLLDIVGGSVDDAQAAALLADGRILVTGRGSAVNTCVVARFNANGTLDNAFGFLGKVGIPNTGSCTDIAVQPDQKMVLRSGKLLLRRHADGSADDSFGADGAFNAEIFGAGLALAADGAVVATGSTTYGTESPDVMQLALTVGRFLPTGQRDPAFAGGNDARLRFTEGSNSVWNALAVQADGRIVAAGYVIGMQELQIGGLIGRFLADGSPDPSFGQGRGWVLAPTPARFAALEVLPDGRLLVAGAEQSQFGSDVFVHRYLPDGTPDTTFNAGAAYFTVASGGGADVRGMAVTANGQIVVGARLSNQPDNFAVIRLAENTTPGISGYDLGGADSTSDLAIGPDGRRVIAGGTGGNMAVAVTTSNSSLDPTFNGNGLVSVVFPSATSFARAVTVQPDNRVVLAGTAISVSNAFDIALARFTPTGTLDAGFGSGGRVRFPIPEGDSGARDLVIQSDGRIVVAGDTPAGNVVLVRFNSNGTIDTTFNGTGRLVLPIIIGNGAVAMALQPDGSLVVAGQREFARVLLDASPTGFAFTPVANAPFNTDVTSNTVAIAGFIGSVPISVVEGSYSINCAANAFTTVPGTVSSGSTVCVRHRTSTLPGHTRTTTLFVGATSATYVSTTGKATPTHVLASSANPAGVQGPITFTATVAGGFGTPTGVVTFRDGAVTIGAATLDAGGVARMTTSSLLAGVHQVTAAYGGDATYNQITTAVFGQQVNGLGITITVGSSNPSSTYGTLLGVSATLPFAPGGGAVFFYANGNFIGADTVGGTTAFFVIRSLPVGTYPITAEFIGYGPYGRSISPPLSQTIVAAASNTVVSAAQPAGELGMPVTLTGVVSGPGFAHTGTVAFKDGATAIPGCAAVPLVDRVATCATAALGLGTHAITAQYSGDNNNIASASSALALPVNADPLLDADHDGIPNGVEPGEGRNLLLKDNDVFASGRLFAMQQYRDFLAREGDAAGISFWASQLDGGAQTRGQMVETFFDSAEFRGQISPVTRLYFAYFLRIPDYGGLNFWIGQSRSGSSLEAISNAFAGSPEFTGTYGALTNAQFVNLVYQNVLGRAADPAGSTFWTGQLTGGLTRGQMMVQFSESPEYRAAIDSEVFVTMMYFGMLRREPDPAGFGFWVQNKDAGNSGQALIQGFLAAPEYRGRFLP